MEPHPHANGNGSVGHLEVVDPRPPADRAEAARYVLTQAGIEPGARHRGQHGEPVQVVAAGLIEADLAPAVLYRYAESGRRYLAPLAAFLGRFRPAPAEPPFRAPEPPPERFRHYKGNAYDLIGIGYPSAEMLAAGAEGGLWFAYRGVESGDAWFRPRDDFYAPVRWPDGVTRPRFVAEGIPDPVPAKEG